MQTLPSDKWEVLTKDGSWHSNAGMNIFPGRTYRHGIRPWTIEEAPELPFVVKTKRGDAQYVITGMEEIGVYLAVVRITWQALFNEYTMLDGSPCGS